MTEKRNNFYVQGPMARHRKYDPERMKKLANERYLQVEDDIVGVMDEQRAQGEEAGLIRDGPFL